MKKSYIYILCATILFSTTEIALKKVISFNPVQITFTRFFIAGLILLPMALKALKEKKLRIGRNDIFHFASLGFLCVVISMMFYQMAIVYTHASIIAQLFSCNPVFILVFSYIILKEKMTKYGITAVILEVLGIIFIINPFRNNLNMTGVFFGVMSALTFALYGVLGKYKVKRYGANTVTCFCFIFGSLELMTLSALSHVPIFSNLIKNTSFEIFANIPFFTGYNINNILNILYICIFVTGIGFACFFKAMEISSAAITSLTFFFKPVLSPILAAIILKEIIPVNMVFGIILIVIGSMILIFPNIIVFIKKEYST